MVTGKPPDELIDRKVPHGIGPATSARDAGGGDIIADLRSAVVLYLVESFNSPDTFYRWAH